MHMFIVSILLASILKGVAIIIIIKTKCKTSHVAYRNLRTHGDNRIYILFVEKFNYNNRMKVRLSFVLVYTGTTDSCF